MTPSRQAARGSTRAYDFILCSLTAGFADAHPTATLCGAPGAPDLLVPTLLLISKAGFADAHSTAALCGAPGAPDLLVPTLLLISKAGFADAHPAAALCGRTRRARFAGAYYLWRVQSAGSEASLVGVGVVAGVGGYEVVEDGDFEQCTAFAELAGEGIVLWRGAELARWVVVYEDYA